MSILEKSTFLYSITAYPTVRGYFPVITANIVFQKTSSLRHVPNSAFNYMFTKGMF
jgi:hypothetical protein